MKENSAPQIIDPHCPQTLFKSLIWNHRFTHNFSASFLVMSKDAKKPSLAGPARHTARWKVKLQSTKPGRALVRSGIDCSALPTLETEIIRGWVAQKAGSSGWEQNGLNTRQRFLGGKRWEKGTAVAPGVENPVRGSPGLSGKWCLGLTDTMGSAPAVNSPSLSCSET